jgi:hypothetical protein
MRPKTANVVMQQLKNFLPQCKFAAAQAAAAAACDAADGVKDSVIENPRACTYDPKQLIGTSTGNCGDFTELDAEVVRRIWQGPRRQDGSFLWYGLQRGADFSGLTSTGGTPLTGRPNPITMEWWRYFLNQNPQWDWTVLTPALYEQYFDQSLEEFSAVPATGNPDLAAFRDRGGKLVLWHGAARRTPPPSPAYSWRPAWGTAAAGPVRSPMASSIPRCAGSNRVRRPWS